MNKAYLIEQITRVKGMIRAYEKANLKAKYPTAKEYVKAVKEIGYGVLNVHDTAISNIEYSHIKHKALENGTKVVLAELLEELVEYGFDNNVTGFDRTFRY